MKKEKKSKVLIVDDHPIVRQGLIQLIDQEPDFQICGEAESAREALNLIATASPDIAIVDLSLKESSGLELIKDIKVRYGQLLVLVLSMHDESVYAERVLRAGARGYLMKEEAAEKVMAALRRVVSGEIYLCDKVAQNILAKMTGGPVTARESLVETLSDRELEVFLLLGQGMGTRQIAEKLHLSVKTIETYREHIKTKLNLVDASELLQHAIRWVQSRQV